ncbi:MAG: hypothetical protein H6Q89_2414 [Myxococcaceae bacterium]|nr:hypothetical protein [Myxococcaceae bacterium]
MKASTRRWLGSGLIICGAVSAVLLIGGPAPQVAPVPAERSPLAAVAPSPASPRERVAVPVAVTAQPAPSVVESEQQLLARAEALLVAEPSRAIDLLRAGDAQYPRGTLADERQFMKLRARVNLDQIAEARVDATDYLELNPHSPLAGRIHQLLGIRPPFEVPH